MDGPRRLRGDVPDAQDAQDPPAHLVERRDAGERRRTAPSWESLTDRLIREAQERGDFDDLPGRGRPLRLDENPYAGDMALAFHVLRNAGAAPPWVEANKELQRLDADRERLYRRAAGAIERDRPTHRRALTRLVEAHTDAVARLNAEAPTDRQRRQPLRLADELAQLERVFADPEAIPPP